MEIQNIATGHDVYFVYHEMSTIVDLHFPASTSGMEFYAYPSDAGAITSPTYEFRNDSEFPVDVSFKGMNVVNANGVTFVSNAVNANEIHLNLELATPSVGTNGLTSGVNNIVPGDVTTVYHLGTMNGSYLGNSGSDTGYVSIGGQFKGPFPGTAKRPELEFSFHFALDMS